MKYFAQSIIGMAALLASVWAIVGHTFIAVLFAFISGCFLRLANDNDPQRKHT